MDAKVARVKFATEMSRFSNVPDRDDALVMDGAIPRRTIRAGRRACRATNGSATTSRTCATITEGALRQGPIALRNQTSSATTPCRAW